MATNSKTSLVKTRRANAVRRMKRLRTIQLGVLGLGVIMVVFSVIIMFQNKADLRRKNLAASIVYGQPLHAVHEMNGAQLDRIPFLPEGSPQPKITVSENLFDFGKIGSKDIVTHDFKIYNQGNAPLTITRAYTTCGCTTADFTATVIPPGKAVMMTLTLDAGFHDVAGQTVRRGVIIENNDPIQPAFEIWIQASVKNN